MKKITTYYTTLKVRLKSAFNIFNIMTMDPITVTLISINISLTMSLFLYLSKRMDRLEEKVISISSAVSYNKARLNILEKAASHLNAQEDH